jgi:hypothetical protein
MATRRNRADIPNDDRLYAAFRTMLVVANEKVLRDTQLRQCLGGPTHLKSGAIERLLYHLNPARLRSLALAVILMRAALES